MDPDKAQVDENPQESMPDSEQKTETQEPAPQEDSLEARALDSEELPNGASDRTREQFDKLKSHSKELERQLYELRQRTFNEERFRSTEATKPLYDKTTGLVNIEALEELQRKADNADRELRNLKDNFQQNSMVARQRELYGAYPELKNPKTAEAKELLDEAERIWMHSQAYPEKYGGESLSEKQATDLAKKRMGKTEAKGASVESKEQASLTASGRPTQGVQNKTTSEEETNRLKVGTRLGDKQSMIARMRAIRESSQ